MFFAKRGWGGGLNQSKVVFPVFQPNSKWVKRWNFEIWSGICENFKRYIQPQMVTYKFLQFYKQIFFHKTDWLSEKGNLQIESKCPEKQWQNVYEKCVHTWGLEGYNPGSLKECNLTRSQKVWIHSQKWQFCALLSSKWIYTFLSVIWGGGGVGGGRQKRTMSVFYGENNKKLCFILNCGTPKSDP